MGSIRKFADEVQVRLTAEELVAMPFEIASGEWIVGSAIARACVSKVQEISARRPELANLQFDRYKVAPKEGEFVVNLRIRQDRKDPLAGV